MRVQAPAWPLQRHFPNNFTSLTPYTVYTNNNHVKVRDKPDGHVILTGPPSTGSSTISIDLVLSQAAAPLSVRLLGPPRSPLR